MCRDVEHGGRRCPQDGAEARRLRRKNSTIIAEYTDQLAEKGITPEVAEIDSEAEVTVLVEKAKTTVNEYSEILARIGEPSAVPVFHTEKLTDDEILAEKKLIELGASVDELARKYDYPADEELAETTEWIEENTRNVSQNATAITNTLFAEAQLRVMIPKGGGEPMALWNMKHVPVEEAYEGKLAKLRAEEPGAVDGFVKAYQKYKDDMLANSNALESQKAHLASLAEKRASAYRKALEEVGVEFAGTDDLAFTANSGGDAEMLKKVSTFYPKAWVENSNKMKKKLTVVEEKGCRANYDHAKGVISYDSTADSESIMLHELGHRMEHSNREVSEAERRFLNRRAGFVAYHAGETSRLPGDEGIKGNFERGYPSAGFAKDYVSKVYDFTNQNDTPAKREKYIEKHGALKGTGFFEVLTMGMESTFYSEHGGNSGLGGVRADKEHGQFILGLLASSAKK